MPKLCQSPITFFVIGSPPIPARYTLAHDGPEVAARAIEYEKSRSFLRTGELFDLLGKYEEDRRTCPMLEPFMPEVVKSFNELAAPPAP